MSGDRSHIPWVAEDTDTPAKGQDDEGQTTAAADTTEARKDTASDDEGGEGLGGGVPKDPDDLERLRDPAIAALLELLTQDRDKRTRFKAAELVLRSLKDGGGIDDALRDILGRD